MLQTLILCALAFQQPTIYGQTAPPAAAAPTVIKVPAGRFLPFTPVGGKPIYAEAKQAYRLYKLAPGQSFVGIKFDAPDGAEPEPWTAPIDAKGPVYALLARNFNGHYTIPLIRNGSDKEDNTPVQDGSPLQIEIVQGGRPPPGPSPVDPPVPDDGKAPIPESGLHVLIVYESGDLSKLPSKQVAILTATALRSYVADRHGEFRAFDKDADLANVDPKWRKAMERKRSQLPWLIVSNGKTGFEGPLPSSVGDMMDLLKRYGQ